MRPSRNRSGVSDPRAGHRRVCTKCKGQGRDLCAASANGRSPGSAGRAASERSCSKAVSMTSSGATASAHIAVGVYGIRPPCYGRAAPLRSLAEEWAAPQTQMPGTRERADVRERGGVVTRNCWKPPRCTRCLAPEVAVRA